MRLEDNQTLPMTSSGCKNRQLMVYLPWMPTKARFFSWEAISGRFFTLIKKKGLNFDGWTLSL